MLFRSEREAARGNLDALAEGDADAGRSDVTQNSEGQDNREGREGREGRTGRARNGRRNERGPRNETNGSADADQQIQPVTNNEDRLAPTAEGDQAPEQRGNEPREKRSRDRYGRDRGARGERAERGDRIEGTESGNVQADQPMQNSAATALEFPQTEGVQGQPGNALANVAVAAATPAQPPSSAPAVNSSAPLQTVPEMPKVTAYALPIDDLQQVASSSGLQWVNSDPARIAAVQAAIAAEPVIAHVPRQRPAAVVTDEGPLILVETKRDLRNMVLPFEENSAS